MSSTLKVLKSSTGLTVKSNKVPRTTSLIVTLKNKDNGALLANKTVSFKVSKWRNKVYKKKTNQNGQVKLIINAKKSFLVLISYAGNSNFYKSSKKTTVYPQKCGTKLSYATFVQYGSDYVITLKKKVNNTAVKSRKVVVKITNKDKSYTKKTNSKGQVLIPICDLGKLKFKISFAGDNIFCQIFCKC